MEGMTKQKLGQLVRNGFPDLATVTFLPDTQLSLGVSAPEFFYNSVLLG